MTSKPRKKQYDFEMNKDKYWMSLLNVGDPSGLLKEIESLMELRDRLQSIALPRA